MKIYTKHVDLQVAIYNLQGITYIWAIFCLCDA